MSRKTPTTRDLRGRTVFTRSETHDLPAQEGTDNPWDMMLKSDEQWQRRPHRLPRIDETYLIVLLIVTAVLIGLFCLMNN